MKSNMSRTQQLLILSIVLALASLAIYVALLLYIQNTNREISVLANSIGVRGQQEMNLRSVQTIAEDTLKDRQKLDTYFVSQDSVVSFIETVEQLAVPTGTLIEITTVEEHEGLEPNDAYAFLRIQFTARGSWSEIFHLISLTEALPFDVEIERTNLEKDGGDEGELWRGAVSIQVVMAR